MTVDTPRLRMRLLCLTSNEFCTSADPADVRRQVEAQLEAAQRSRKAYPHAYRAEGYKVLHVGSGSFAKHDRRHHQSDHNYVWTVLDVRTPAATPTVGVAAAVPGAPASTPPKHPVDVYVACFQEMFVRSSLHPSQAKTARTMDAVLRAHGLGHRYEVETKGKIRGEATLTSAGKVVGKRMGLGLYVWSRAPLAEQTALKTASLHRKTRTSTKRMLRQVLVGPRFTLTVGNVHLPMKENLRIDGKGVDPTNPMRQDARNAMLAKALHSMDVDHALKHEVTRRSRTRKRSRGGRRAPTRRRSRALHTLPASPESYANVVHTRDMLSGTDRNVPYAHPHVPAGWGDVVYEWLTRTPSEAFCPTCEFVHNRPLAMGTGDDTGHAHGWNDVPEVPVDVKPKAWTVEATGSPYKLIKKRSYNVPSYCDRALVRVRPGGGRGGGPHVQLLVGDMNYRVLPSAFVERTTASKKK